MLVTDDRPPRRHRRRRPHRGEGHRRGAGDAPRRRGHPLPPLEPAAVDVGMTCGGTVQPLLREPQRQRLAHRRLRRRPRHAGPRPRARAAALPAHLHRPPRRLARATPRRRRGPPPRRAGRARRSGHAARPHPRPVHDPRPRRRPSGAEADLRHGPRTSPSSASSAPPPRPPPSAASFRRRACPPTASPSSARSACRSAATTPPRSPSPSPPACCRRATRRSISADRSRDEPLKGFSLAMTDEAHEDGRESADRRRLEAADATVRGCEGRAGDQPLRRRFRRRAPRPPRPASAADGVGAAVGPPPLPGCEGGQ